MSGQQGSGGSSPSPQELKKMGAPYPPTNAGLGGVPTVGVDVPIDSVIIALFIGAAAANMTIFQLNRRRSHKFVLSGLVFGFCMARITANVLRIVWAVYPHDINVAIAAGVFTNAGVMLLFVVNLIFAQRVLRAYHPHIGWSKPGKLVFRFLYAGILCCLIMVVIAVVYSFFTLDKHVLSQLNDVKLAAVTYLSILAFIPVVTVAFCFIIPRRAPMDKFGQGRMRTKLFLLLFTSTLLTLGASFRAGNAFLPHPASNPGWINNKACYFCFNYTIELIVVYTYTICRFDRRFHVPNGSSAPGHYSRDVAGSKYYKEAPRVNTEEEVFGFDEPPRTDDEQTEREQAWDARLQDELEKRESV